MDLWTNFFDFCIVLNKLFNILHAFSLCILCLFKLINFVQTKNTLFSLLNSGKKGLKTPRNAGWGVWVYAPYNGAYGRGDRRQTNGFDQNIIRLADFTNQRLVLYEPPVNDATHARFPRIARAVQYALTFDLALSKVHSVDPPPPLS